MRRLASAWRIATSTWLAAVLILCVAVIATIGSLLPQVAVTSPEALAAWQSGHPGITAVARPLGLFGAFSSWPFIVLLAALALDLAACTIDRFVRIGRPKAFPRFPLLGSLLLHLGLLALLAGGVLTAAYRFDGTAVATEGQVVNLGVPQGYVRLSRGPLAQRQAPPQVELELEGFRPTYRSRVPTRFTSDIVLRSPDGGARRVGVGVNRPETIRGFAVTQADFGFSPDLLVADADGRPIVDALVALSSRRTGTETVYEDFIPMPGTEDRIMLRVYPDVSRRGGRGGSASPEPKDPALWARLVNRAGVTRDEALLKPGKEATLAGYRVIFRDLRYWSAFRIAKDPGLPVVYGGFVVCLIGLVLRYVHLGPAPGTEAGAGPGARAGEGEGEAAQ